jgi:hypothetical protein
MTDSKIDTVHPFRKKRGRSWFDFQIDPSVLKPSRIIERERHLLTSVMAFQIWDEPQLHHQLEPVADSQNQFTCVNEVQELIEKPSFSSGYFCILDTVRSGFGRAQVIPIQKATWKIQEMVVIKILFPVDQLVDMNDIHDL